MADDIKLPPLPLERAALESGVKVYAEYTLRQYARDAIKADRKRRGEPAAYRSWRRDIARWEYHSKKTEDITCEPLFTAPHPAGPVKVPSDEELYDLAESMGAVIVCNGEGDYNDNVDSIVSYARTLLARYGTTVSCQIYGHPLQACSECNHEKSLATTEQAEAYAAAKVKEALLEAYRSMQELHMSLMNDATLYVHPAQVASFSANRISALIKSKETK